MRRHILLLIFITQIVYLSSGVNSAQFSAEMPLQDEQRKLAVRPSIIGGLPGSSKRFALVIGADEYDDPQINRLAGASNDANAIAGALIGYAGFPKDQVIVLTSDQSLERRPTRGNILRRLSNLRTVVPKDGLLLLSFAGHGIEREGRAYLLPTDAQVSGDVALLEETAINAELIRNWIRQTGVGQVLIILDACRNNPSAGRGDGLTPLTESYTRGFSFDTLNSEVVAFVTLYATEVGQTAFEYKDRKQGYFTRALVEGLGGAAADEKGEVSLASLIRYLQAVIPKRVSIDLGARSRQRPFAIVEGYKADELIIAISPPHKMVPSAGIQTPTQIDPLADERSFWETIRNSNNGDSFKAYLQQYPNGRFAKLARIKLDELYAKYGAIAFSKASGRVGYSIDQSSQDIAAKKALDNCQMKDCMVTIWFKDACGAFAQGYIDKQFDGGNKFGWAWAKSKSDAEQAALANCRGEIDTRRRGVDCRLAFSICTTRGDQK